MAYEGFLTQFVERGFKIKEVYHEGAALPKADFDRLSKTAAGIPANNCVCKSLGVGNGERVFAHPGRIPELYHAAIGTLKNTSVLCLPSRFTRAFL